MLVKNIRRTLLYLWSLTSFLTIFQPTILSSESWAETTLEQMSLKEKVAQLFMPAVYTHGPRSNVEQIISVLNEYPVGAILFMQGTISCQQQAAVALQQQSKLPLLCGQDAEWGLSMRLPEALRFPRNLTLGAIQDDSLIYQLGQEIARQCKGVGVHIDFAPVVDVNNNPGNTVIHDRSFGEQADKVGQKSAAWIQGLQSAHVLGCAKHFPGHGDTTLDSHLTLPVLNKTISNLQSLEWIPFQDIFKSGVSSVMLGHLYFPKFSQMPASLCSLTINNLLKKQLGFEGLIFSDALNMKAITDHYPEGESEVLAFEAGNDILVFPQDYKKSIEAITQAVVSGRIEPKTLDQHVLKILQTKEKLGLHQSRGLQKVDLFSKSAKELKERLFKEAITAIEWDSKLLPLPLDKKCALVQVGLDVSIKGAIEMTEEKEALSERSGEQLPLYAALKTHRDVDYFFLSKRSSQEDIRKLEKKLKSYSHVVFGFYEMHKDVNKHFNLNLNSLKLVESLKDQHIYVCVFGSPYSLKYFEKPGVLLMGYENDEDVQQGCAEILLGNRAPKGKLPISASERYPVNFSANCH